MDAEFDLKHLRHFVLLAEELNFTRAAERANLSQTAFSRSVQALEAGLGVRVFDRGTRSVHLTSAGQTLVARARQMLAQAADLAREVEGLAQATGGMLAFGASLMAIDGALEGVLPKLRAQSPLLRLDIAVGNWRILKTPLEQEKIEFFVGYPGALAQDPDYTTFALAPETASIYCRAGHPLASGATAPLARQLRDYPWANVAMAENLSARRRVLLGMPPDAPLPLAFTCDSQTLLREAVLGSDMLLLTWDSWVRADVRKRALVDLGSRLRPKLPRDVRLI
ncbi:MAG: LysR family transcriptional regulator, partial [Burkholderiales bacterium]|nr:LysR family transcriptional regulator [Burkholderiales bacterium]